MELKRDQQDHEEKSEFSSDQKMTDKNRGTDRNRWLGWGGFVFFVCHFFVSSELGVHFGNRRLKPFKSLASSASSLNFADAFHGIESQ